MADTVHDFHDELKEMEGEVHDGEAVSAVKVWIHEEREAYVGRMRQKLP